MSTGNSIHLEKVESSKVADEYWHVYLGAKKIGKVFINIVNEAPFGEHASIQVFINTSDQGKGAGSLAFEMACRASRQEVIYAHVRKSNIASRKAAEHAGFVVDTTPGQTQLTMIWKRPA